jgi:hypothetical protein
MRIQTIMLAASLCIAGCALPPTKTTAPPQATEQQQPTSSPLTTDTAPAPRVISVDGREIREADAGKFTSWVCRDYFQRGKVVVEVGHFNHPKLDGVGFVIYDGGNSGMLASYERAGLLHRWDWEWNDNRHAFTYSFLMKPDGTGLYYDFSSANGGHKEKADDIFRCQSR